MDRGNPESSFRNPIGLRCVFSLRCERCWTSGECPNVGVEQRRLLCEKLLIELSPCADSVQTLHFYAPSSLCEPCRCEFDVFSLFSLTNVS